MHSFVDAHLIQKWAYICDSEHRSLCKWNAQYWRDHCGALRLIDVVEWRIATFKLDGIPTYLAPSYVWGSELALHCLKSSVDELTQKDALRTFPYLSRLSKTITDAMILTTRAGLRYLWADMLCIIQDDPDDKWIQLQVISSLYKCAYFTMITMDGNHAQSGIRGSSELTPQISLIATLQVERRMEFVYSQKPEFSAALYGLLAGRHFRSVFFRKDVSSSLMTWSSRSAIQANSTSTPILRAKENHAYCDRIYQAHVKTLCAGVKTLTLKITGF